MELFMGKAGCQTCHTPPLFTDRLYHNVGIGMNAESPDMGRAKKTKNDQDKGKFKTPTLREIAKTAPYFHDGSVKTLREAVKLMASGGIENPHRQAMDKALLTDKQLSDEEIDQLVAFLQALSGDVPFPAPAVPE
ncbi:MAG TPA: c-type cytochrome [bacterium]|nr:c-type cytochrome [bacterium]